MFSKPTKEQVIALAGIFQACQLVETLAKTGSIPNDRFEIAINSLFQTNPENTLSVFGSLDNLQLGFESMQELITLQSKAQNSDTIRYVIGVSHLSKKLIRNKKMLAEIATRLDQVNAQADHFSPTHPNVSANLAQVYLDTISTFRHRVQVSGNPSYLRQDNIAEKIRCLLFAAIRASVLWLQLGGKRHHIIFHRKTILQILRELQQ